MQIALSHYNMLSRSRPLDVNNDVIVINCLCPRLTVIVAARHTFVLQVLT